MGKEAKNTTRHPLRCTARAHADVRVTSRSVGWVGVRPHTAEPVALQTPAYVCGQSPRQTLKALGEQGAYNAPTPPAPG